MCPVCAFMTTSTILSGLVSAGGVSAFAVKKMQIPPLGKRLRDKASELKKLSSSSVEAASLPSVREPYR
jgi:hypothetical protein